MYNLEEFDKAKIKILKYIMYKKRTEREVRARFESEIEENMLDDIIEYLKENNYIDDKIYIQKTINNFKILKNLSIKELKFKLISKGINSNNLEDFFYENQNELEEYEIQSAKNIILKKNRELEKEEITRYLLRKGYKIDNINQAFEQLN